MEILLDYLVACVGGLIYTPVWILVFFILERLILKCSSCREIKNRKIINDKSIGMFSYCLIVIILILSIIWLPKEIKKLNEENIIIVLSSFICSVIFYIKVILKEDFFKKKILMINEILMDNKYVLNRDAKVDFSDLLGEDLNEKEFSAKKSEYEKFIDEYIGFKYTKYCLTKNNKEEYMRAYLFLKESEELINKNYKKLKSIKIKRKLDYSIYLELAKIVTFDSLNSYDDFCFYFLNKITAYNIFIIDRESFMYNLISSYSLLVKLKFLSKEDIDMILIDLYLENAEQLSFKDSIALLKYFKFNIDVNKMKNDYKKDKNNYISTVKYNLKKQIEE